MNGSSSSVSVGQQKDRDDSRVTHGPDDALARRAHWAAMLGTSAGAARSDKLGPGTQRHIRRAARGTPLIAVVCNPARLSLLVPPHAWTRATGSAVPLPSPTPRGNVGPLGVDTQAESAAQHEVQMTPTREPPDRSDELHGALLQLLLNTSGDDFEPERVLLESLQLLSRACQPIKNELGQAADTASEEGQRDASQLAELQRQLADAREHVGTAEALVAQAVRRAENAESEREEFEENAARTLEEELDKASQMAAAALEEANAINRKAM